MTRDSIQGFIDGYLGSGGDPSKIREAVENWLDTHPRYKPTDGQKSAILSDLSSYQGVPKG